MSRFARFRHDRNKRRIAQFRERKNKQGPARSFQGTARSRLAPKNFSDDGRRTSSRVAGGSGSRPMEWLRSASDVAFRAVRRKTVDGKAYFGDRRPHELAQSSSCDAVSARRALFKSASFPSLGGRREAFSRSSVANVLNRSLRDVVCLRRGYDLLLVEVPNRGCLCPRCLPG